MRVFYSLLLGTASIAGLSAPALAQDAAPAVTSAVNSDNAIIVTARRRDEALQDVPGVIDVVTAEDVAKLNLRDFKEVENLVPGLSLDREANGVGGSAKLRGVNFDVTASGFNSTVEFYFNDAPITAGMVLQQMFDIGQIEVLRGPQGTLRGRASPSGSITVTTRKPDLYEVGGYTNMTANNIGGLNFNGGLNVPVIEGIAAIRVAGVWDENELDRVESIEGGRDPFSRTKAGRVSGIIQPVDWLRFEGVYQRLDRIARVWDQAASFSEANPNAIPSPVYIDTSDRLSLLEEPRSIRQIYDIYNWRAEARLAGQALIYQGQLSKQDIASTTNTDNANFFKGRDFFQFTNSKSKSTSHEIRLQNDTRLFGMLDYVVGFFDKKDDAPTSLTQPTPVRLPSGGVATVAVTPILRTGGSHEQSFFGNLTAHIGESTEISGGLRHIDYNSANVLVVSGRTLSTDGQDAKKWIYTASVKHEFTPDFMLYASTGSSWRPGINVVGNFSLAQSPVERSFLNLPAETSKSYEIGLKSTLMGGRMRFNLTGYHQKFENYPYRVGGSGAYYINTRFNNTTGTTFQEVGSFNFVGAVPVEVNGIEGDVSYDINDRFNIGVVASYALGKIKDGVVPCNDLNGDGIPDVVVQAPTLAELSAAVGADNLATCTVSQRSAFQAPLSATVQSEYQIPVSAQVDGYLRGLVSFNGKSKGDPTNPYDNVSAYALANLYAGIRDPEGMWEVSLFAKNLLNTEKTLTRTTPLVTNYQQIGAGGVSAASFTSSYTGVTMTPPREFGINVRYAFGSR